MPTVDSFQVDFAKSARVESRSYAFEALDRELQYTYVMNNAKQAAITLVNAVHDAIKAAGRNGVPAGHLYTMLMGFGFAIETFELIKDILIGSGKITERSHVLVAVL